MQENCTFSIIPYGITMSKILRCLFSVPHLHYLFPLSVSGATIVYFLYYYSFSIHFRDHLAIITNVSVGYLVLFYLILFPYLYIDIYNKRQPACLDYRL